MTILHLLSQHQLTGAEVYACHLIEEQTRAGHRCLQVSNQFFFPTLAEKISLHVEAPNKISFIFQVYKLIQIFKKEKVQILHAHSRAASKLAFWSVCLHNFFSKNKIGYVSTIHGRQHNSFSKKIHNIYGQFQIAVSPEIQKQLVNEFNHAAFQVKLIPNGIHLDRFQFLKKEFYQPKKIAIIGRATGPKKDRTENFLAALAETEFIKKNKIEIHFLGAEKTQIHIPTSLVHNQNLNQDQSPLQRLSEPQVKIFFHDHINLSSELFHQFDLIVGSGRVCMEALCAGIPCFAYGEAALHGLVCLENFNEALSTNFGDITDQFHLPQVTAIAIDQALTTNYLISIQQLQDLSNKAQEIFDLHKVHKKIIRLYESAYFKAHIPYWIPVLMYHKIPDHELTSPHKIFVTQDRFLKHLQFFKWAGFQTLTTSELAAYRQGLKNFNQFPKKPLIITFDDGYVDNLKNADPLLKKFNFKAQIFLLAHPSIDYNHWDAPHKNEGDAIVSKNDRKLWLQSNFEIGSHGLSHARLTDLNEQDIKAELIKSKNDLENEFGQKINAYAYTFGSTNQRIAELTEAAGYDYGFNTDTGALTLEDHPYQIFRVNIFPNESFFSLWKKTSRWYRKRYFYQRGK